MWYETLGFVEGRMGETTPRCYLCPNTDGLRTDDGTRCEMHRGEPFPPSPGAFFIRDGQVVHRLPDGREVLATPQPTEVGKDDESAAS